MSITATIVTANAGNPPKWELSVYDDGSGLCSVVIELRGETWDAELAKSGENGKNSAVWMRRVPVQELQDVPEAAAYPAWS
jgi:hypothetical protein